MKDDDDLILNYLFGAYDASREWRDAAEFEARVAEKLARCNYEIPKGMNAIQAAVWRKNKKGELVMHAPASRLKCARINVEEEMG